MAETNSLLNCRTRLGYRGFESPLLRQKTLKRGVFFLIRDNAAGHSEARLSRLLWEQEIPSSNLGAPTSKKHEMMK